MIKNKKISIFFTIITLIVAVFFYFLYFESLIFNAQTKLIYKNGYQIIFSFNQPVIKKSFEDNFQIKPSVESKIIWQEKNKKAIYQPYYLEYNKTYPVSFKNTKSYFLKTLKDQKFEFKIDPPSFHSLERIPNQPQKLPIKRKNVFLKPNGEKVALDQPKIQEGKYIDVDISDQILTLYKNGKPINIYEVSTGRIGMPTPEGKFKVLTKEENHWSYNYRLYMPYSLKFTNAGHYIHELPYWPGGYREGVDHLGARVSHGCIRLGIGPAEKVYNFAEIGTPIIIHE